MDIAAAAIVSESNKYFISIWLRGRREIRKGKKSLCNKFIVITKNTIKSK
jgi:hypothetical protein